MSLLRGPLAPGWPQAAHLQTVYMALWLLRVHIWVKALNSLHDFKASHHSSSEISGYGQQISVCTCPISCAIRGNEKGLISGQFGRVFPELLSIMSKHTSFCRHFICSQGSHQGLGFSSEQWAQESHSLLYKKSGSNLDSCISLSRHTRHVDAITCWNNAALITIRVTLGKTTNTEQRQGILTLLKGIQRLNLWLPMFGQPVIFVGGKTFTYSYKKSTSRT